MKAHFSMGMPIKLCTFVLATLLQIKIQMLARHRFKQNLKQAHKIAEATSVKLPICGISKKNDPLKTRPGLPGPSNPGSSEQWLGNYKRTVNWVGH